MQWMVVSLLRRSVNKVSAIVCVCVLTNVVIGEIQNALGVLAYMDSKKLQLSPLAFTPLIVACGTFRQLDAGLKVLEWDFVQLN